MRILLHICCGPCAAYPVKTLKENGHEITGYFYNPNIHPYKEFMRRLETAQEFAGKAGIELIADKEYELETFLRNALINLDKRCSYCYESRLRQAAKFAKQNGYECFSTSLLVSPYQKHDIIKATCEKIALEEKIPFLYVDFRDGWNEGVQISKDMELYRQPYCGCIFSEKERYCRNRKEKK